MLRLTTKGKDLMAKNGGIVRFQSIQAGNFDYSEYADWNAIFEEFADEVGGWDYYTRIENPDTCAPYTESESRDRLNREFKATAQEMTLDEIIADGDSYGVGVKFGYLEEVDE